MDPLAEKYYSISPYAYVGNNPINAADLRGDTITTIIDGEVYYYGKYNSTYGFINKKTGEYYMGDNKFSSKLNKAIATLQLGERGAELVGLLINDKRTVSISESQGENKFDGGIRNASVIWNSDKTDGGWNQRGDDQRPSFIGLGHEFAHVEGFWTGRAVKDYKWAPGAPGLEQYATYVENQLRSEFGVPLRTHYGLSEDPSTGKIIGGDPNTAIIDGKGNNLFYFNVQQHTTVIIDGIPVTTITNIPYKR